MKRMMFLLMLAACTRPVEIPGPQPPLLVPVAEKGDEGCWHEQDGWFETPCDLTREETASLQRALAARGLFDGPANGVNGPLTQAAVRAYQTRYGLESDVLSLGAARSLGIVPVPM